MSQRGIRPLCGLKDKQERKTQTFHTRVFFFFPLSVLYVYLTTVIGKFTEIHEKTDFKILSDSEIDNWQLQHQKNNFCLLITPQYKFTKRSFITKITQVKHQSYMLQHYSVQVTAAAAQLEASR